MTLYLALSAGFCFRSLSAAKSSGESDGTDVTIPVPLVIEIVSSGSTNTVACGARGAESGTPRSSWPVTVLTGAGLGSGPEARRSW